MKSVLKQLNKQLERVERNIEKKEDVFWNRSDTWQESDNGVDFMDKISELEEVRDNLQMSIESLEMFLGV